MPPKSSGPSRMGRRGKTNKTPLYTDQCPKRDTHKMLKILGKPMTLAKKGPTGCTEEVIPALVAKDRYLRAL